MVSRVVDKAGGIDAIWVARNWRGEGPAREGAGAGFDVVLRVVGLPVHAYPEREQLQQLTAVVLVDGALMAHAVVEIEEHRWVSGNLQQDVPEAAEATAAEHIKLDKLLFVVLHFGRAGA